MVEVTLQETKDPGKGTLTLVSEKSISKAQAFNLLTSQLRLQGYAVVTGDGFADIVIGSSAPTLEGSGKIGQSTPATS